MGIYVGDNKMVHAPASGRQVQLVHLDDRPWPKLFISAVRMLQ